MQLNNYVKVYNLGHRAILDLFSDPVILQEKVDGSQFSFGITPDGELLCSSHHQALNLDSAGMFQPAVDYIKSIKDKLTTGLTYRGEFLAKPHHNTLKYNRTPQNFVIIFDIDMGQENYMLPVDVKFHALSLGLETVPELTFAIQGNVTLDLLKELLERESVLGVTKIEGVVIKNYRRFGVDGHCLMGKYVSEKFKEMHQKDWKQKNPSQMDIVQQLSAELKTDARWMKAVQHLKEQGLLKDEPADIGILLKELNRDIEEECREYVKDRLYSQVRKQILQGATKGFPEFYKRLLMKKQFEKGN